MNCTAWHSRPSFLVPSNTSHSISYPKQPPWGLHFSNTRQFAVSWINIYFTICINLKILPFSKRLSSSPILWLVKWMYPVQISVLWEALSKTSTNTFLFTLTLLYLYFNTELNFSMIYMIACLSVSLRTRYASQVTFILFNHYATFNFQQTFVKWVEPCLSVAFIK